MSDLSPLDTAVLAVVRSNSGAITLREIIAGFYQFHYSELEIRGAVQRLQSAGNIAPNWDWRYEVS